MQNQNLYKAINGLRYLGVGSKVTNSVYKLPDTYWIITRRKITRDYSRGPIYGRLVWRGKAKEGDMKITNALKKDWKIVELPNYAAFEGKVEQIEAIIPKGGRSC